MCLGNRLHQLAVRGCLIAGVVLLTAGVGPCESQETARETLDVAQSALENAGAEEQKQPTQGRPQDRRSEPPRCASDRPTIVLSCPTGGVVDANTKQQKESSDSFEWSNYTLRWDKLLGDSVAQWLMAFTGLIAISVSYFALVFTKGTLIEQRKSTKIAIDAFIEENRAWLNIVSVSIYSSSEQDTRGYTFDVLLRWKILEDHLHRIS